MEARKEPFYKKFQGRIVAQVTLTAFLLIVPTVAVFKGNNTGATILAAVAIAALLLLRLPEVSTFELFGLKARLERQFDKVQITVKELQRMAAAFARANLNQMAMSGQHLHGIKTSEKFSVRDEIIDSLRQIGTPIGDILKAQDLWICVYCTFIYGNIKSNALLRMPPADLNAQLATLKQKADWNLPEPSALRAWGAEIPQSNPELTILIEEYERVWTTGSMKNPDLIEFNRALPFN